MKKIVLALFLLLLVASPAFAEKILAVSFTVNTDGTAEISSLQVKDSNVFLPDDSGNYKLQLLDKESKVLFGTRFSPDFYLAGLGLVKTDSFFVKIPWNNSFHYIKIFNGEKQIHFEALAPHICNGNSECEEDKGENEQLCQIDCGLPAEEPADETIPGVIPEDENPWFYYALLAILLVLLVLLLNSAKASIQQ